MNIIEIDGSKLTDICQVAGVHLFGTDDGEVLVYKNFLDAPRVNRIASHCDSDAYQVNVSNELSDKFFDPAGTLVTMEIENIVSHGLRITRHCVTYLGFGPKSKTWVFFGTRRPWK